MHSALPKVLQPLAGRPLLAHVLGLRAGAEAPRDPRRLWPRRRAGAAAFAETAVHVGAPGRAARHRPRRHAGDAGDSRRARRARALRRRAAGAARRRCSSSWRSRRPGSSRCSPPARRTPPATAASCATRDGDVARIVEEKDASRRAARDQRDQHRHSSLSRAGAARLARRARRRTTRRASTTSPTSSAWRSRTAMPSWHRRPNPRPRCSASTTRPQLAAAGTRSSAADTPRTHGRPA